MIQYCNVFYLLTGDNEIHGNDGTAIWIYKHACQEACSTTCHSPFCWTRNSICCIKKYQSDCTETVGKIIMKYENYCIENKYNSA